VPASNNLPMDEQQFQRLYGPWRPMQPAAVASLFPSVAPLLERPARDWLLSSLRLSEPQSPWVDRLRGLD